MRRYFHHELQDLRTKLILIGEKANEAARIAVEGFLESDMEKIACAFDLDDEIDQLEMEIDRASVRYITLRAPVSSDVRLIFVAMKVSHDFERAGDEAHSIAKKARAILTRDGVVAHKGVIEEMAQKVCLMMNDAITCFVEEDLELAQKVILLDKEIDRLNKENFKILSNTIPQDADQISTQVETIFISKSLERIGDHAKNLAQEVSYLLNGE